MGLQTRTGLFQMLGTAGLNAGAHGREQRRLPQSAARLERRLARKGDLDAFSLEHTHMFGERVGYRQQ